MVLWPAGLRDDEAKMPKWMSLHESCRINASELSFTCDPFGLHLSYKRRY